MDIDLMIKVLPVLIILFYTLAILSFLTGKIDLDKSNNVKIKKDSKSYKNFSSRLQNIVNSSQAKIDEEDRVNKMIGKKDGVVRKFQKSVLGTFQGGILNSGIMKIIFMSTIVDIGISVLILVSAGPVYAALAFFSMIFTILAGINIYKAKKEVGIYDQIANFMTINYSQYLSSSNFEESIQKTLEALRPGSFSYAVAMKFRTRVFELNMPLSRALTLMKDEFVNASHIVQYLDIVYKAETIDPTYKKSVGGIPENFAMLIKVKRDFTNGIMIIFIATLVMNMVAFGWTIIGGLFDSQFILALNDPVGTKIITVSYVVILILSFIVFRSSGENIERQWNDE